MKINISNLSEGTHEYELSKKVQELGLDENFVGSVSVKVELQKSSRQFFLRAQISACTTFQCDRCLENVERILTTGYKGIYLWNANDSSTRDADDIHLLTHDMNVIDISDDVRQYLLLSVPLKLLCKDACAGICPSCGKNLNFKPQGKCDCEVEDLDPRWGSLQHLLGKSMSSGHN